MIVVPRLSKGHAYLLGDYIVRVGQCKKGAVYRGLCLEVSSKYSSLG